MDEWMDGWMDGWMEIVCMQERGPGAWKLNVFPCVAYLAQGKVPEHFCLALRQPRHVKPLPLFVWLALSSSPAS